VVSNTRQALPAIQVRPLLDSVLVIVGRHRRQVQPCRRVIENKPTLTPCMGKQSGDSAAAESGVPGSLRTSTSTSTQTEIGRARTTYLQGECSYLQMTREEEEEEYNVGRVLVINTPPARSWYTVWEGAFNTFWEGGFI